MSIAAFISGDVGPGVTIPTFVTRGLSIGEAVVPEETLPVRLYYATARRVRGANRFVAYKGGMELIKFDWTAWAAENGALSSVVWLVEHGDITVSSETLTSSVAQAKLAFNEIGSGLIKLTATSTGGVDIQYLQIMTKRIGAFADDYGLCA